jgi:hypothetical protein
MSFIIRDKWVWIIIGACILILVSPYIAMWVILQLPDIWKISSVFLIVFGWAAVSGYKDWLRDRRKREKFLAPITE